MFPSKKVCFEPPTHAQVTSIFKDLAQKWFTRMGGPCPIFPDLVAESWLFQKKWRMDLYAYLFTPSLSPRV